MYTNKTKIYICSVDDLLKNHWQQRVSYIEMNCCPNQYLKSTLFFKHNKHFSESTYPVHFPCSLFQ